MCRVRVLSGLAVLSGVKGRVRDLPQAPPGAGGDSRALAALLGEGLSCGQRDNQELGLSLHPETGRVLSAGTRVWHSPWSRAFLRTRGKGLRAVVRTSAAGSGVWVWVLGSGRVS